MSFWFAPSSIVFVNRYSQNYYSLISWPPPQLLLLALDLGTRAYMGLSHATTDDAKYSMCLGLLSTQAPVIFCGTHSAKLPFFQKLWQLAWLSTLLLKTAKNWGRGLYAPDKLNIWANAPSALCPQIVCKNGDVFSGCTLDHATEFRWMFFFYTFLLCIETNMPGHYTHSVGDLHIATSLGEHWVLSIVDWSTFDFYILVLVSVNEIMVYELLFESQPKAAVTMCVIIVIA